MLLSHIAGSARGRRLASTVASIVVSGAAMAAALPANAADAPWPHRVSAQYKLYFNGFDVGAYRFQSTSDGKTYNATSNADVSALFGAFKWRGSIVARGQLAASKPQPAVYALSFRAKSKAGGVKLNFDPAGVKTVVLTPKKAPKPDAVPVKPEHLKAVFDPLSAVLAMTRTGDPCKQKIAVFDGKVRFNLAMSFKAVTSLPGPKVQGQPHELHVCKVKYEPIAGHKPKDFENPWVDYNGIEIAFRPVPAASIFVPYKISVPTTIGAAVMVAERIDITAADKAEIALIR
ncbi:MAG: DUF3108 domain-containing protein [Hyphomicrobium sp.]